MVRKTDTHDVNSEFTIDRAIRHEKVMIKARCKGGQMPLTRRFHPVSSPFLI